jgi:uncharacterized protein YndB with AHSA1/START domain
MTDLDIANQVGAIERSVRLGERDGRSLRVIVAERTYKGELEDVWDALTAPHRIPRWLAPISGDLRLGGRYQIEGNAGGDITTCEPPTLLQVTWEFQGDVSWVEARLAAVDGGVHLTVEHSAHPNPEWEAQGFGPGAVGIGWDLSLFGLALYIEDDLGRRHPTSDPEAWFKSSEARAFMTGSGTQWGEADIASGTSSATAREAATKTIQAYMGA